MSDSSDSAAVPESPGEIVRQSPADGTISGVPVYSDMHCPLLVDEADIHTEPVIERHVDADGNDAGRTVHRRREQVLTNPVDCPTCGKMVERHALVAVPDEGVRDCAIAIGARKFPASKHGRKLAALGLTVPVDAPALPATRTIEDVMTLARERIANAITGEEHAAASAEYERLRSLYPMAAGA